mmetsp:Transcript_24777/g.69569  ORF Transcript_24777/g.69569 Transcript_24777/m.69569 type:complete len:344 (+) Transcript_24777:157-1188(+)|eukprot:CAMPEP_0119561468 /NCGR_PEP_ID=MMETSP1352-20130426/17712_1 /TAXON_ID=265584 /ORGANISM="Stauroneis constricta, Strain CCMP1120" /LENGTH=343 /DNA_ID=CAMNT_0007609683 /DNA_START=149 /DNA_END=1180 /DNA_ORIENTATION=+
MTRLSDVAGLVAMVASIMMMSQTADAFSVTSPFGVVVGANGNSNNNRQRLQPPAISTRQTAAALSSSSTSTTLMMARPSGGKRYAPIVVEVKPPMNDEISAKEIRVVAQNNSGKDEVLGIMSPQEAMSKAKELGGLDLIMINQSATPPVCKIVDYSKFRYMQEKKAKEVKKNSKSTEIKEVKMSYKIDVHDYGVRKKNASKFLSQGNRVKCTVMFRGREMQHDKLGYELLDKLAEDLSKLSTREGRAKREGRSIAMFLTPRTEVVKAVADSRKAGEKAKKKKKEEEKQQKADSKTVTTAAGAAAAAAAGTKIVDDEEIDLEGSLDANIDDLFGGDDLTDDLFD